MSSSSKYIIIHFQVFLVIFIDSINTLSSYRDNALLQNSKIIHNTVSNSSRINLNWHLVLYYKIVI
jgi:hypothetical protein